ncbi:hypothetical protein AGLY_000093, partial [Aphis glycines]
MWCKRDVRMDNGRDVKLTMSSEHTSAVLKAVGSSVPRKSEHMHKIRPPSVNRYCSKALSLNIIIFGGFPVFDSPLCCTGVRTILRKLIDSLELHICCCNRYSIKCVTVVFPLNSCNIIHYILKIIYNRLCIRSNSIWFPRYNDLESAIKLLTKIFTGIPSFRFKVNGLCVFMSIGNFCFYINYIYHQ